MKNRRTVTQVLPGELLQSLISVPNINDVVEKIRKDKRRGLQDLFQRFVAVRLHKESMVHVFRSIQGARARALERNGRAQGCVHECS